MAGTRTGETHVALLRGINVGGKNKLPMKGLADLFAAAGATDVRTYIQSGNVVYRAGARAASRLAAAVHDAIRETYGLDIPVVTRRADELSAAVRANPFVAAGADEDLLHVMFLAGAPPAERVAALEPDRSPPDRFAVRGREVYLLLPNGAARSKLTNAWFDTKLGAVSTGRNWRTVLTLLGMATGARP